MTESKIAWWTEKLMFSDFGWLLFVCIKLFLPLFPPDTAR